jgi:hypothetical protein
MAAPWFEEAELTPDAGHQSDDTGGDGEWPYLRSGTDSGGVLPDQVGEGAGAEASEGPSEHTDENRADRVEVYGEFKAALDGIAQDDVDCDRHRHQDDDSGGELASYPAPE